MTCTICHKPTGKFPSGLCSYCWWKFEKKLVNQITFGQSTHLTGYDKTFSALTVKYTRI